ncbi:MAG: hypothetical protein IH986_01400 [Planctomycetes bacterium]|nr:hypothetical protein [Planctomycetota bacterium]
MAYGARRKPRDGIHKAVGGDTISSIAASYGFTDWEAKVWNAGENAGLKQERVNPNTLAPRSEVFVPELDEKQKSRPTDEWHDFHVVRNKRLLRLKLHDEADQPLANKQYTITPGESFRGMFVQQGQTTDAEGVLQEEIPHTMLDAELELPEEHLRVKLQIGFLLPLPMSETVKNGVAGCIEGAVNAVGGAGGGLLGAATGAAGAVTGGGGVSSGASIDASSGGFSAGASLEGAVEAAGSVLSNASGAYASAAAMAGSVANAVANVFGEGAFGQSEDLNVPPAAQRLTSMGFDPGEPGNRADSQFTAALMAFQTWCKKCGDLAQDAGGMLGGLTGPESLLGGIGSSIAGAVLSKIGLSGQLDDETIEALK